MTSLEDISNLVKQYSSEQTEPLRAQLTSTQAQLAAAQQTQTDLQRQIAALEAKLTAAQQVEVDLRRQLADAGAQIIALQEQLNPTPDPEPEPEPETIAFGLSTHTNFRTSVYGDDARTREATLSVGPTYLRDLLSTFSTRDALWRTYIDAGVKSWHVTVGAYGETRKDVMKAQLLKSADIIHEATGWNEPDSNGRTIDVWLPPVVAWQKWLYTTVKSTPELAHIKVGLGAIRGENPNGAAELQRLMRDAAGFFDFVDIHCYPGPRPDDAIRKDVDDHIAWARPTWAPDTRVVFSETGGSMANMDAQTQARVITTVLQHLTTKGVDAYIYEVLDDVDSTGKDLQSNFGIFESDYTPKAAAHALATLAGL